MSNSRFTILARFLTLSLAVAMFGCTAQIPDAEELAQLEGEGPYSDEVAVTTEALSSSAYSSGFVWAHNPTAASYTPMSSYSYNYKGGTNTVTRLGPGRYRVTLPSLSLPGNAQVVAYGGTSHRCALGVRPSAAGGGVQLSVYCHTAGGVAADATFVAFYGNHNETVTGEQAYAFADYESGLAEGVTLRDAQFISSVTRQSAGYYSVVLGGSTGQGTAFATAVSTNGAFCSVSNYNSTFARFNVHCFSASGVSADTDFSLLNLKAADFFGLRHASARAMQSADHSSMGYYSSQGEDNVYFDWNTATYVQRAELNSVYSVQLPSTALVTYEGNGAFWCKPQGWSHNAGQMNIMVNCFDTSGALRNVRFSVLGAWAAPTATLVGFSN